MKFWTGKLDASKIIHNMHELQALAIHIIVLPATQVPCERSFSDLSFVFNCRRSQLDQKVLERILLIKENIALWEQFKQEELCNISKNQQFTL